MKAGGGRLAKEGKNVSLKSLVIFTEYKGFEQPDKARVTFG